MSKQQNIVGYIFKDRYQIKRKLKSGGFASVYVAKDLNQKNRFVAVKVMEPKSKFYAQVEFQMYQKIKQNNFTYGFVKHFHHGLQNNKYFIVMQLLDRDLDEIVQLVKNRRFSLKTVLMIGLQVIDRLEAFHKIGYLHRDVKPDNLVIGFEEKNKIIYLIDFGLAKKINQIRSDQKDKLLGSLGYMSCRAHQGKPTGFADDVESLIYTLIQLYTGSLPWSKLQINTIAETHKILLMKKKLAKTDFKNSSVPASFFQILDKMKATPINQKIDYLMIKYKMLDTLKEINSENDFTFDWSNLKTLSPQKLGKKRQISPEKLKRQQQKEQNQKEIQKEIYLVYKFLDPQVKQESSKKQIRQKQNIVKKIEREKINKNLAEKTLYKKDQRKNRPSSVVNKKPVIEMGYTIKNLAKISQTFGSIRYEGPNIVINKTAKHKI